VSLVLLFWAAAQASGDALPCDLTVHPDRIDRLTYGAHNQQAYFGPPLPDPAPFTDTPGLATSPSWLARRSFGTHLQQSFAGPPIVAGSPDQFIPTVYADATRGRSFGAHLQQAYVAPPQSFQAFDLSVHPDWLPPKGRHAALAQAYTGPIEPDATAPAASFDLTVHPDRIDRRTYPAHLQLAHVLPASPGVPTFDLSIFPDAIAPKRALPAHLQQAYVAPVFQQPVAFDMSVHPDRIDRRSYGAHQQQAFTGPQPPQPVPFDLTVHPDRVWRPTYPAHLQQAFTGTITEGTFVPIVDVVWEGTASVSLLSARNSTVSWMTASGEVSTLLPRSSVVVVLDAQASEVHAGASGDARVRGKR
jgi:hypothetical protein